MSAHRIGSQGTIPFTFDGRDYLGRAGDSLASALLANGVRVVGRSFKYHRPRGIWGFWTEEPNALLDVSENGRTTPNLRATTEMLRAGLSLRSVNAHPTAEGDRFGALDRLSAFLPAGFYYKTFLWPDWHRFEPRIRAMAGLGTIDPAHAPEADVSTLNAAVDTLVIGAGPAGLAAARAARGSVMLVDDRPEPGGSLLWCDAEIEGQPGAAWAADTGQALEAAGHTVLSRTTAFGVYDANLVTLWQRREGQPDRLWRVRAGEIVLAAGAIERPLVFPDNDRPGVMSSEAALFYLRRHDVAVGERVTVVGNNDRAWNTAAALARTGARVILADTRTESLRPAPEGVELRRGARVEAVHGTKRVEGVSVEGRRREADCVAVSGGWTPTVHLFCQNRGKLRYDEELAAFVPGDPVAGMRVVGAANGTFVLGDALAEAHGEGSPAPRVSAGEGTYAVTPLWPKPAKKTRQWIDLQNDVTLKDVELAARENFRSVEHLKRYTTLGMATDQGKTSNMNGLAAMAELTGRTIPETGTTTYRPPFVPVPFTAIAGRRRGQLFNPVRRLVLEAEHRKNGAVFREYGGWLRPAWYGQGEKDAAVAREAERARNAVAILDGSPLGKIEVMGPGAAALVDFNSYNTLSTLKPNRIRYGFMLTESGVVYDDGVTLKLADDHYVVSCSSGHVAGVSARLEEWRQDRFDPSQAFVHNATAQWATLSASGPRAKALVEALALGVNLDDASLPHMAFTQGRFGAHPARVARVSFTGDRSYEISVPSHAASALLAAMQEAARPLDGGVMGSEALLLLRAEKGYLIAGKDTDGTTMPQDLGVSGPRLKRRDEFVGKRSLFTEEAERPNRAQFVGLESDRFLPVGAHGVESANGARRSIGFVTSSYRSPSLGRPIALALIERGLSRMGETIALVHLGQNFEARIAAPCAFDPEGARLNA